MNKIPMIRHSLARWMLLAACLAAPLFGASPASSHSLENQPSEEQIVAYGADVIVGIAGQDMPSLPDPQDSSRQVQQVARVKSATTGTEIRLNFIGEWTSEQVEAMNYAASKWAGLIYSPTPIEVDTEWKDLSYGIGQCGYFIFELDDDNAPHSQTFYPITLANAITGTDNDSRYPDMYINFDTGYALYFGADGQTPADQFDFVTVAMHEFGHGFIGGDSFVQYGTDMYAWGGAQWGYTTFIPYIMDWHMVNGSGQPLMDTNIFPNPSTALFDQFAQDQIYFSGPATLANNANQAGQLNRYDRSHIHEKYADTQNSMMVSAIPSGENNHNPGPIVLGMLDDMGWEVTANLAPDIRQMPTVLVEMNGTASPALDLWAYITDTHSQPNELTYSIINTPAPKAGVALRGNRYIDITPQSGWLDKTQVEIKAQDPQGLSSTASFKVLVLEKVFKLGLPLINR